MSTTPDLVSLEDTPLTTPQSHELNSLLDDIQSEQQPTTPALPVLTPEKTALRVKTNQFRKSVDFHPSVVEWAASQEGRQAGVVIVNPDAPSDADEEDPSKKFGPVTERRLHLHPTKQQGNRWTHEIETKLP